MNNLRINIYGEDQKENDKKEVIVPLYISKETFYIPKIHLLMIKNSEIDIYNEDYSNNEIWIYNSVRHIA